MLLKHHYPFPTPQSPFPPIIWGKNTCSSANVTVLEGGKQQRRGWTWPKGRFKQGPLCLRAGLVSSRLFLAWPVLLWEGRGFIKPSWLILGLLPPQVHTSLLPGGSVTGSRVMGSPALSAPSLGLYNRNKSSSAQGVPFEEKLLSLISMVLISTSSF